ncbi:NADPH-dependent FMN reductase [Saccharopolyspora kobensis]|uniref:NADPH-dependent FMN reductase n=1 Tax=Saccharopolyspora kobensis TaxID=146035 RepID=UPI001C42FC7E|nr:NADPH-dependent FMN reductase [Saccharopolyspora kobensis]
MVEVLLITGSTRSGSTNTAALRTAREVAPDGVTAVLHEGLADLPAFNPDDDVEPLPRAVAELRNRVAAADAVLFCTPEYAGTLPGSFKNLLDWSIGGTELNGKPVAWLNVAPEGRGDGAIGALTTVLRYLAVDLVEAACGRLFVPREAVGPDGLVEDAGIRDGLREVLRTLAGRSA